MKMNAHHVMLVDGDEKGANILIEKEERCNVKHW